MSRLSRGILKLMFDINRDGVCIDKLTFANVILLRLSIFVLRIILCVRNKEMLSMLIVS